MVLTLSRAVDLVGVTDVYHGRRVAIIAVECARRLGLPRATQRLIFDCGLLHDCGVSSTCEHSNIVAEEVVCDLAQHTQRGAEALARFLPLAHLAPIVLHHHTDWSQLGSSGLSSEDAQIANLIYLADRVDAMAGSHYRDQSVLLVVDAIRERVRDAAGRRFAPKLVEAFLAASAPEAFWLRLDVAYIPQYVEEMEGAAPTRLSSLEELQSFATLIADIVDAKSHFTAEHSFGVARLTRYLGAEHGFSGERLSKMEIAALLHDIGKLQVPDEILDAPRALDASERAIIKKHSFATYQILKQIGGFEELAMWAGAHHESLDGGGYPFRLKGDEISTEARIIKIADVYQALAQRRPYRDAMQAEEIMETLDEMARRGELDGALLECLRFNQEACHRAATGGLRV